MTPAELRAACTNALAFAAKHNTPPGVQLIVPREPRGRRVRLLPSVLAEVLCVSLGPDRKPQTVVCADPAAILAWLDREGA